MSKIAVLVLSISLFASSALAQLPRLGSTISNNEKAYFGIGRGRGNYDSMKVVKGAGLTLLCMSRGTVVDSIIFTVDEVPILERYLRDFEKLLVGGPNPVGRDSAMRRILDRVAPGERFDRSVKMVAVRLSDGSVKTGLALAASDENILLSDGASFVPATDVQERHFTCIPVSQIAHITYDVGEESPRWFLVQGDYLRFRTAIRIVSPTRAYMYCVPPEVETCMSVVQDDLGDGAPLSLVCPRTTGWTFSAFGGLLSTLVKPTAFVTQSLSKDVTDNALSVQPMTYSSGVELSFFISQLFDVGFRGIVHAQPSTINDSSRQNSFGFDSFSLQFVGTWHIVPIDSVGYNKVGLSTTFAVGPSVLNYRGRTYRDTRNFTTTGTGAAFDAAWSANVSFALSRSFAVGVRAFAMYQYGYRTSMNNIVHSDPFEEPLKVSFNVPWQSMVLLGAQLFTSYTFE